MTYSDSTRVAFHLSDSAQTTKTNHQGQPTPREILSWLPRDATPEQQDSAIQAHIQPAEIRWSNRPDTLHLPGHPVGKSYRDARLPLYYKETFFSGDSLLHPELPGGRPGVAGDPVPYTIAGDDLLTGLLLSCFILGCISFAQSRGFIVRQFKNFFHVRNSGTSEIAETTSEIRFQVFLCVQTCLLFSILYFFYMRTFQGDTFILEQYKIIGIVASLLAAYLLVKAVCYGMVNWVFFDKKSNGEWFKSFLFIVSSEGVLLLPLVMLQTYFHLTTESSVLYTTIVILLVKLLSFYKQYLIFFRRKGAFLQNILYFCALEIVPLFALWGVLTIAANYLKINF